MACRRANSRARAGSRAATPTTVTPGTSLAGFTTACGAMAAAPSTPTRSISTAGTYLARMGSRQRGFAGIASAQSHGGRRGRGAPARDDQRVDAAVDAPPASPDGGSWWSRLARERSVQITVVAWLVAYVLILLIARGHLPFHRPSMVDSPFAMQVLSPWVAMLEVL